MRQAPTWYASGAKEHIDTASKQLSAGVAEVMASNSGVTGGIVACTILQHQLWAINGSDYGRYEVQLAAACELLLRLRGNRPIRRFAQGFFQYADMSLVRRSSPISGISGNGQPWCPLI